MKKMINTLFSLLIAVAMFTPNVILAEDYKTKDFDFNKALADQLGIDLSSMLDDEDIEDQVSLEEDNQTISYEVIRTKLPESISVDLFKPLVLYFDLKAGVRIDNVIWYLEGSDYAEPHQVTGKYTNSNLLIVPSCAYKYNDFVIEAEVDYTDFRDGKEEKGKTYLSTKIHINDENTNSRMQVVNVGNFSIFPNQTLNLSKLGIGKGTISLNEDGNVVTLNNVEYTYDPNELFVDRLFTMNRGFAYFTFNNDFNDVEFNLIGENKISNLYRAFNIDSDGAAFDIVCGGNDIVQFNPNYHLNGPGSLVLYGGQHILQSYGSIFINTKLDLISSKYEIEGNKTTPARMGTGIYCVSATFTDKADVNMDIAGVGVNADLAVDPSLGNITFKPGSKLNIKNTSYIRHPWLEMFLPSKISGITYTNVLDIDGAEIHMNLIADADLYHKYEEIYELSDIPVYLISGVSSNSKDGSENNVYINNSVVDINIDVACEEDDEYELIKATGFDVYKSYSGEDEEPSVMLIKDSNVDINIGKHKHIEVCYGMIVSDLKVENSDMNISNYGDASSFGIVSTETKTIKDRPNVMEFIDSDVNIKTDSYDDNQGKAYGVYGVNMYFTYNDESKEFVVESKNGAVVSYLDKGEVELDPIKNYSPVNTFLLGDSRIKNNQLINRVSLTKRIDNGFFANLASSNTNEDSEKTELTATNRYYYYETICAENDIAKNVVITKNKVTPKPHPYIAPNTCAK